MTAPVLLASLALGGLALFLAPRPGAAGGGTVPTGGSAPPGGGSGSGGAPGGGSGSAPPGSPPGAPSGPWPAPGTLWSPRADEPKVLAMPWSSRTEIQGWPEKLTDDAPASRHETICALLDAKRLDLPTFVRIPVRGGLEVEAMTDVVQFGGVRLCMGQQTAQAICDAWGCMMMTSGIADAVWKHAHVRMPVLNIDPNPGGAKQWLLYEADRLGAAFNQRAAKLLEAGTPFLPGFSIVDPLGKDYVLDPRLKAEPGQCAIYGWHNGKDGSDLAVIQSGGTGASLKHHLGFFDYSQMVRLVRRQAWLGGVAVDLADIYEKRPELVNHRGVMGTPPIPARHPAVPFRASGGGVA